MDRNDRIVVLVGIVILVVAVIGIMYHEKTYTAAEQTIESHTYNVNWEEKTVTLQDEGHAVKGKTSEYNYSINHDGLMCVSFELEWTDDLSRGFIIPWNWSDTFDMKISAPNNTKFSGPGSVSGSVSPLTVDAKIRDMPSSLQINASNETEVSKALGNYISSDGKGQWTVSLDITTKPFFFDRGNDFTLHVSYTYYEPVITKVNS